MRYAPQPDGDVRYAPQLDGDVLYAPQLDDDVLYAHQPDDDVLYPLQHALGVLYARRDPAHRQSVAAPNAAFTAVPHLEAPQSAVPVGHQ